MPTMIDPEQDIVTLVNVFTVAPAKRQELVDALEVATAEVMRHRQGFVSANFHVSLDGTRVINYAQWRSEADFQAMLADPTAREHMVSASALAVADPTLCRVVSVHGT